MNFHKKRVIVFGGSHAGALFKVLRQELSPLHFVVENRTIPGHILVNFSLFPKPEELKEEDWLIVFTGGNDVFKRNIEISKNSKGGKTIHLTECIAEDMSLLRERYEKLGEKLDSLKCRKLVIQNPYRHLHCCKLHNTKFPSIVATQKSANKCLAQCLQEKAIICCHLEIFGISCRVKRDSRKYAKLFSDTVHFVLKRYVIAAKNIGKILEK